MKVKEQECEMIAVGPRYQHSEEGYVEKHMLFCEILKGGSLDLN